jgi:hypothetical protein
LAASARRGLAAAANPGDAGVGGRLSRGEIPRFSRRHGRSPAPSRPREASQVVEPRKGQKTGPTLERRLLSPGRGGYRQRERLARESASHPQPRDMIHPMAAFAQRTTGPARMTPVSAAAAASSSAAAGLQRTPRSAFAGPRVPSARTAASAPSRPSPLLEDHGWVPRISLAASRACDWVCPSCIVRQLGGEQALRAELVLTSAATALGEPPTPHARR